MKRLGGVLNLSEVGSSVKKGETLYDTMQMIEGYADIAVIGTLDKEPRNMRQML